MINQCGVLMDGKRAICFCIYLATSEALFKQISDMYIGGMNNQQDWHEAAEMQFLAIAIDKYSGTSQCLVFTG